MTVPAEDGREPACAVSQPPGLRVAFCVDRIVDSLSNLLLHRNKRTRVTPGAGQRLLGGPPCTTRAP